jgi:uncharacterized protein YegL
MTKGLAGDLLATEEVVRRSLTIFFLIDTSGSMSGAPIGAVNEAMEKVVDDMKQMDAGNADAEVSFAVMTFDDTPKWMTPNGPIAIKDYEWQSVNTGTITQLGAAVQELNSKLSTKAFMKQASGSLAPVFILISDGLPTDELQYNKNIEKLWENNWFKVGMKFAMSYDFAEGKDVFNKFTRNDESLINIETPELLRNVIRFVSVTASDVASDTSSIVKQKDNANDPSNGAAAIVQELKDDDGNVTVDMDFDWSNDEW